MITTVAENDVLLQWFSNTYLRKNEKLFSKIVVEPGQVIFMIEDGKLGEVISETTKGNLPGFLGKLKEKLVGQKEYQLLTADLGIKHLRLPVTGYLKDRVQIACIVNADVQISRENIYNCINLLKDNLISDGKFGDDAPEAKEVCIQDLTESFAYDTKVIVDSAVFSRYSSESLRESMQEFQADIASSVNSLMPHWAECGINVSVVSVDVVENGYEVVKREAAESRLNILRKETEYAETEHDLITASNLKKLITRLEGEEKFDSYRIDAKLQDQKINDELDRSIRMVQNQNTIELMNTDTQLEIHRRMKDTEDVDKQRDRDNRLKDADIEAEVLRRVEKLKNDMELDYQERLSGIKNNDTVAKMKIEFEAKLAQADNDAKMAYNEGLAKGREEGKKEVSIAEYNRGYADGLERNQKSIDLKNTTPQGPYFTPYQPYMQQYQQPIAQQPAPQAATAGNGPFCQYCGTRLGENSKFCPSCGKQR